MEKEAREGEQKDATDTEAEAQFPKDEEIMEMLKCMVHIGNRKTRQHPKMAPYVFGVRSSVSIIDLTRTREKLTEALQYLKSAVAEGRQVLFVDTRPFSQDLTRKIAEEVGMPHITVRWSGGTITNWKTIHERIDYMKDLEAKMASEAALKYTKKERYKMEQELKKLNLIWQGVRNMQNLPDIVFVVDMSEDALAVKEANRKKIPVVAIADTNVDPTQAAYPIPASDNVLSSVQYILGKVKEAIMEGKSEKSSNAKAQVSNEPQNATT